MTCIVQQPLGLSAEHACVQEFTDTPILDLRWTGPLKRGDEAYDQVRMSQQPDQCPNFQQNLSIFRYRGLIVLVGRTKHSRGLDPPASADLGPSVVDDHRHLTDA